LGTKAGITPTGILITTRAGSTFMEIMVSVRMIVHV
jgi:hypothetical protein